MPASASARSRAPARARRARRAATRARARGSGSTGGWLLRAPRGARVRRAAVARPGRRRPPRRATRASALSPTRASRRMAVRRSSRPSAASAASRRSTSRAACVCGYVVVPCASRPLRPRPIGVKARRPRTLGVSARRPSPAARRAAPSARATGAELARPRRVVEDAAGVGVGAQQQEGVEAAEPLEMREVDRLGRVVLRVVVGAHERPLPGVGGHARNARDQERPQPRCR